MSVVLPAFNAARHLGRAIESILDQQLRAFELILIDDGSVDHTSRVISKYAENDSRIVALRNEVNQGLVYSLNRGVSASRSVYIARQDADDFSYPQRLERQARFLDEHIEVGVLASAYYRCYPDGSRSLRTPPTTDTKIRWRLLFGNCLCHSSIMFRRNLLEPGEPAYGDHWAEDYELWCRLLDRSKGFVLPEPLVDYRDYPGEGFSEENRIVQEQSAIEVSSGRIRECLSEIELTADDTRVLRAVGRAAIPPHDVRRLGLFFKLVDRFSRQRGSDPIAMEAIRRNWINKYFTSLSFKRFYKALRSGSLLLVLKWRGVRTLSAIPYLAKAWARPLAHRLGAGRSVLERSS